VRTPQTEVDEQYEPEDDPGRIAQWGLVPQWQACLEFDSLDRLPACAAPLHVFALSQDVQTPPGHGRRMAVAAPNGHFHLFEGMGHTSIVGHMHNILNPSIRGLVEGHL
jgi:hypothetical protein